MQSVKTILEDYKNSRAVLQLYGYMSFNYLRYGSLTNYDYTLFFRRPKADGLLEISRPVHRRHIIRYLLQFINMKVSKGDMKCKAVQDAPVLSSEKQVLKSDNERAQKIAVSADQYYLKNMISSNGRGTVHNANVSGIEGDIIIKVRDISKQLAGASEMKDEAKIYVALSDIEGTIIPSFYGLIDLNGFFWGLVMDHCGQEVSDECLVERIDEIIQMVSELHKRGCIHGDLLPKNITQDKNGKVWIIDFSHGKLNATEKDIEKRWRVCKTSKSHV